MVTNVSVLWSAVDEVARESIAITAADLEATIASLGALAQQDTLTTSQISDLENLPSGSNELQTATLTGVAVDLPAANAGRPTLLQTDAALLTVQTAGAAPNDHAEYDTHLIRATGGGQTTIRAGAGVTFVPSGDVSLAQQEEVRLTHTSNDVWLVTTGVAAGPSSYTDGAAVAAVKAAAVTTATAGEVPLLDGSGQIAAAQLGNAPSASQPDLYLASNYSGTDEGKIQAAIDAAEAAGGGAVYIPAGTWNVTTIKLKSAVNVRGAGPDRTIIATSGGGSGTRGVFEIAAGTVRYVTLADMTIEGSNATDQWALYFEGTNDGTNTGGLWFSYVDNLRITRFEGGIWLRGSRTSAGFPIQFNKFTGIHCFQVGTSTTPCWYATGQTNQITVRDMNLYDGSAGVADKLGMRIGVDPAEEANSSAIIPRGHIYDLVSVLDGSTAIELRGSDNCVFRTLYLEHLDNGVDARASSGNRANNSVNLYHPRFATVATSSVPAGSALIRAGDLSVVNVHHLMIAEAGVDTTNAVLFEELSDTASVNLFSLDKWKGAIDGSDSAVPELETATHFPRDCDYHLRMAGKRGFFTLATDNNTINNIRTTWAQGESSIFEVVAGTASIVRFKGAAAGPNYAVTPGGADLEFSPGEVGRLTRCKCGTGGVYLVEKVI